MGKSDPQPPPPQFRPPFRWSEWLWRPWWLKAWWLGAAIFWIIALFDVVKVQRPDDFIVLILLFNPFALLIYVGFRAAWIWNICGQFPWSGAGSEGDPTQDDESPIDFEGRRARSAAEYLSDPIDLRSPLNPSNYIYKRHRGR